MKLEFKKQYDHDQLFSFLGTLPHLKSLQVDGNPMKSIRRDIIARGTMGLLKYLKSRIDEDELKRLREKGKTQGTRPPSKSAGADVRCTFLARSRHWYTHSGRRRTPNSRTPC